MYRSKRFSEIFLNFSENDVGNVFFALHRKETDVLPVLRSLLKSRGIRVLADVNSCNSIVDLREISDQRFQIRDFHIGDNEKVQVLPSLNQGNKVLKIQSGPSSKVLAEGTINHLTFLRIVQDLFASHGGVTKVVNGHPRIVSQIGISSARSSENCIRQG